MKKAMSRLIALALILMLTLSMSALAAETASEPYRVPGATQRPQGEEKQEPEQPGQGGEVSSAPVEGSGETPEAPEEGEPETPEAPEQGEPLPPEEEQPEPETPAAAGRKVVTGGTVNVRAEASGGAKILGQVQAGDVVEVLAEQGAWTKIRTASGLEGYMASKYLAEPAEPAEPEEPEQPAEPEEPEQPVVTDEPVAEPEVPSYNIGDEVEMTADVDVRLGADGMSEIIETLPAGGKLTVLEVEGDWVKVEIDGQIGYVFIDDLPGLVLPEQPEEPLPEGELPPVKVTIFTSRRSVMAPGEEIHLTSKIEGLENYSESKLQWQCNKGDGFEDVPGANEDSYTFEASVETLAYDWRLLVYCR